MIKIIVNGQERKFQDGITLADVITQLGLEEKVMAAAVNMQIVKQENWGEKILQEGDKLELLDFVGGG